MVSTSARTVLLSWLDYCCLQFELPTDTLPDYQGQFVGAIIGFIILVPYIQHYLRPKLASGSEFRFSITNVWYADL
jgi:hypothetical protein